MIDGMGIHNGVTVMKCICGVRVLLGGGRLIYSAPQLRET
jgi:hypothetical protein